MLRKAYSLVHVKGFDPQKRTFSGIATNPETDRVGDTIASDGVTYKNPLPLLLHHDSTKPIGEAWFSKATTDGTPFTARISTIDRPGVVKDRLDEAVDSLSANPPLIRGVSIGFMPLEDPIYDKATKGFHFPSIEVHELSMVTIPAHQAATIAMLKSLDIDRAASGDLVTPPSNPAGVSASTRAPVKLRSTERPMRKSFADQIADWEKTRAAKAARQEAIQDKATDEGRGKDDAEREEFGTLEAEIKSIDAELVDLHKLEERDRKAASPVKPEGGLQVRTGAHITVDQSLPPGIMFARYAMCMGMSRGNVYEAKQLATEHYGDNAAPILKLMELQQKTAIGAGAALTSHAYDDLVPYNLMDDFITYLRPRTIIGKFGTTVNGTTYPALNRVGFNVRTSGFSAGHTANWVGEGLPIPVSRAVSYTVTLTWAKIAALSVLTKEEIRFSNPSAEAKVRDDLAASIVQKQDLDFINPAKAAVANVSPASITWNTTPSLTTGTTAATFRTDFATLLALFATALLTPEDIVIIMSTAQALNVSLMLSSLGVPVFPGITMAGGYLLGFPVITTSAMVSTGSPVSDIIVAVKAGEVYLADDGVVTVDASDQASIEMYSDSSSMTGISGTGASLVSLWQTGMVGLKATREVNWKIRRTGAARYIYNAAYKA